LSGQASGQFEVKKVGEVTIFRLYKRKAYEPERKPSAKRFFRRLRALFPCQAGIIKAEELEGLITKTFGSDYQYYVLISDEWFRAITKEQMEQLLKEDDTDTLPYIPTYADCPIPPETAYALGLFFAEGSCGFRDGTASGAWWRIVAEKEYLEKAKAGLEAYPRFPVSFEIKPFNSYKEGAKTNFGERKRDLYCLEVHAQECGARRDFIRAFYRMFYLDGLLDYKKVPGCIYDSSLEAKRAFLEGVIDGDGGRNENRITIVGDLALTGIIKLMKDLHWTFGISVEPRAKRPDVYYVSYGRSREWYTDILQAIDGQGWVSLKWISDRTGIPLPRIMKATKRLEEEGYIISRKPWSQRREVKLAHPYNLCDDFSDVLLGQLTRKTWNQGYAIGQIWWYCSEFGHAQNLFSDGKQIFIVEPQNDEITTWDAIKGQYKDARAYMVKF
jgi:hypothetical protein